MEPVGKHLRQTGSRAFLQKIPDLRVNVLLEAKTTLTGQ